MTAAGAVAKPGANATTRPTGPPARSPVGRSAGVRADEFAGRDDVPTRRRDGGVTLAGALATRRVFPITLARLLITLAMFVTTTAMFLTTLVMFVATLAMFLATPGTFLTAPGRGSSARDRLPGGLSR